VRTAPGPGVPPGVCTWLHRSWPRPAAQITDKAEALRKGTTVIEAAGRAEAALLGANQALEDWEQGLVALAPRG
jgi:hypothetical protein